MTLCYAFLMKLRKFELQPTLIGDRIELRPIHEDDFDALYEAASDPLIWEQHPQSDRFKIDVFQLYFDSAIQSHSAFVIIDRTSGSIIGSSRYYDTKPASKTITIGYTFLSRKYWGGSYNRELKALMLNHAFQFVDYVLFEIGDTNIRSQKAILKIGATLLEKRNLEGRRHHIYSLNRADYQSMLYYFNGL